MAASIDYQQKTSSWIQVLSQMFRFRLARRLFLVVFVAIVLIEFIIIFPSYANFKSSRLDDYREMAGISALTIRQYQGLDFAELNNRLLQIVSREPLLVGVTIIKNDGSIAINAGETVDTQIGFSAKSNGKLVENENRYEIFFPTPANEASIGVIVRMDSSTISSELRAYVVRISGLVLIICAVVGTIVFFYVSINFVHPLEEIRKSLRKAKLEPTTADRNIISHSRNDELGETIDLLNDALREIGESHRSDVAFQEKRLRDFAAAGSDWFWEMDNKLRFSYFSDQFETVTGMPTRALLGKTREETGIPNTTPGAWAAHLKALRDHKAFRSFVHPREKPDGTKVWLSISGSPVSDSNGNFLGFRGTGSDVTELQLAQLALVKAKEAAEQGNRAKSDFLATMSHEVRTPMNGVIGMTELLLETDMNEEQKQLLRIIQESGSALLHIINDILDFSKLEARQIHLEQVEFKYNDVIAGVIGILGPQAREKNLSLEYEACEEAEITLLGDYGRLRQVLINLVGNALKFTDSGSVSIRIEPVSGVDETLRLRTIVSDTGIGIPQNALGKLFDSFTQVDASTSRRFGGTGLGLAISRKIIEAMQGEIGVSSVENKGSQFWFEVEFRRGDMDDRDDTVTIIPGQQFKTDNTGLQLRILVADDILVNQMVLEKMLGGAGYLVDSVANGVAAIEAVKSVDYDLILMDIQMPIMDGLEATRRIQALGESYRSIPILAITANIQPSDRNLYLQAGMSDFIGKPIIKKDLIALVDRFLPFREALKTG